MTRPILNIADVEFRPWGHGDRYEARIGKLQQMRFISKAQAAAEGYWEGE